MPITHLSGKPESTPSDEISLNAEKFILGVTPSTKKYGQGQFILSLPDYNVSIYFSLVAALGLPDMIKRTLDRAIRDGHLTEEDIADAEAERSSDNETITEKS